MKYFTRAIINLLMSILFSICFLFKPELFRELSGLFLGTFLLNFIAWSEVE